MDAALEAANPRSIIRQNVKLANSRLEVCGVKLSLGRFRRILVIGGGKASGQMGEALEKILGPRITDGLVIVPDYLRPFPKGRRIKYCAGAHPIPSRENIRSTNEMLRLVRNVQPTDLVIVLISGGASALMESPVTGVRLEDERKLTSLLLKSGADIHDMNIVRKHLSRVKGGRLAEVLKGSEVLALILSDVVGNEIGSIGSGPTAPDSSSYGDAVNILHKFDLWSRVPVSARNVFQKGVRGVLAETPKDQDEAFRQVTNMILGGNRESCSAASARLRSAGYQCMILSNRMVGEAREVGRLIGSMITDVRENETPLSPPAALIFGGETTVTVRGTGTGGRNQEVALAAALAISGVEDVVVGSLATDGVDGLTSAAGAMVDGDTVAEGRRRGMNVETYLANNDSYGYFSKLGGLIRTGPTGTNVNDIMIAIAGGR